MAEAGSQHTSILGVSICAGILFFLDSKDAVQLRLVCKESRTLVDSLLFKASVLLPLAAEPVLDTIDPAELGSFHRQLTGLKVLNIKVAGTQKTGGTSNEAHEQDAAQPNEDDEPIDSAFLFNDANCTGAWERCMHYLSAYAASAGTLRPEVLSLSISADAALAPPAALGTTLIHLLPNLRAISIRLHSTVQRTHWKRDSRQQLDALLSALSACSQLHMLVLQTSSSGCLHPLSDNEVSALCMMPRLRQFGYGGIHINAVQLKKLTQSMQQLQVLGTHELSEEAVLCLPHVTTLVSPAQLADSLIHPSATWQQMSACAQLLAGSEQVEPPPAGSSLSSLHRESMQSASGGNSGSSSRSHNVQRWQPSSPGHGLHLCQHLLSMLPSLDHISACSFSMDRQDGWAPKLPGALQQVCERFAHCADAWALELICEPQDLPPDAPAAWTEELALQHGGLPHVRNIAVYSFCPEGGDDVLQDLQQAARAAANAHTLAFSFEMVPECDDILKNMACAMLSELPMLEDVHYLLPVHAGVNDMLYCSQLVALARACHGRSLRLHCYGLSGLLFPVLQGMLIYARSTVQLVSQ